MNRECFTLLFMRFETPKARQLQRKFNAAFYEMEKALLKSSANASDSMWLEARTQSKLARREETDVIQKFVEYATAQGSQNAKHYYTHITNASYKCLELIQHKKPKLRDTLDYMQLAHLMAAEGLAARCLEQYMENGEHYKVIYELVKNDLERFAEGLKLPKPKI
jgi:hypothetical protein